MLLSEDAGYPLAVAVVQFGFSQHQKPSTTGAEGRFEHDGQVLAEVLLGLLLASDDALPEVLSIAQQGVLPADEELAEELSGKGALGGVGGLWVPLGWQLGADALEEKIFGRTVAPGVALDGDWRGFVGKVVGELCFVEVVGSGEAELLQLLDEGGAGWVFGADDVAIGGEGQHDVGEFVLEPQEVGRCVEVWRAVSQSDFAGGVEVEDAGELGSHDEAGCFKCGMVAGEVGYRAMILNSVRRFCARPASVSLGAVG